MYQKSGAKALKSLKQFRDDFVFEYKDTGKMLLVYIDNQDEYILTDYQGNTEIINQKSGCCLLPCTYILGKSYDYVELLNDASSSRARYKE